MGRYEGLDASLRAFVNIRDHGRCRWCGISSRHPDPHHIRYRRGPSDDVAENLILLCRQCHDFVHGAVAPNGNTISKGEAQEILFDLITMPGVTGLSLMRARRRQRQQQGTLCAHGRPTDLGKCSFCLSEKLRDLDAAQ